MSKTKKYQDTVATATATTAIDSSAIVDSANTVTANIEVDIEADLDAQQTAQDLADDDAIGAVQIDETNDAGGVEIETTPTPCADSNKSATNIIKC